MLSRFETLLGRQENPLDILVMKKRYPKILRELGYQDAVVDGKKALRKKVFRYRKKRANPTRVARFSSFVFFLRLEGREVFFLFREGRFDAGRAEGGLVKDETDFRHLVDVDFLREGAADEAFRLLEFLDLLMGILAVEERDVDVRVAIVVRDDDLVHADDA